VGCGHLISIYRRMGVFSFALVFLPDFDELSALAASLGSFQIIRVRQTPASLASCWSHRSVAGTYRTVTIDLTCALDDIWNGMNQTCRRHIRKAERLLRDKLEISKNGINDDQAFLSVYNRLAQQKRHSGPMSIRELARLRQVCDVSVARYEGNPISVHLTVRDQSAGWVIGFYFATVRLDGRQEAQLSALANRLLHWRELQDYRLLGFECYDFGSIHQNVEDPEYGGITRFKMSFGGTVVVQNSYYLAGFLGRATYRSLRTLPWVKALLRGRVAAS
jgi:Acetyltransferase (GNAT) domain